LLGLRAASMARRRDSHDCDEHPAEPSDEKLYTSEPLETDNGTVAIRQQNVGPGNEPPAPGAR